jgi:hypothetical protein
MEKIWCQIGFCWSAFSGCKIAEKRTDIYWNGASIELSFGLKFFILIWVTV